MSSALVRHWKAIKRLHISHQSSGILLRVDKIGDLVSTLPVDSIFQENNIKTTWLISEGLQFLCEKSGRSVFWAVSANKNSTAFFRLLSELKAAVGLAKKLRSAKFDFSVSYYVPWWVNLALWISGIRVRVGRKSQWHSFIFLNFGIRQSRSLGEKHEAQYNFELSQHALEKVMPQAKLSAPESLPNLKLEVPANRYLLEKWQLQSKNFFVVHPGMAGSALNWPMSHYSILIEKLVQAGVVVITGTDTDLRLISSLEAEWKNHPNVRWTIGALSMDDLLSVLAMSRGLIAPSTGVLHLGASVGIPCVGIYSPIPTQSPKRWGPRAKLAKVIAPDVDCPAGTKCLGPSCVHFNCMEKILVNRVLSAISSL